MTVRICPYCQNDDTSMMEEVGVFTIPPGDNGSSNPAIREIAWLCFVCGKVFKVKEPPRG